MKYKLNRNVTQKECDWLDRDMNKGEIVYSYPFCTYGCIGDGKAVTLKENKNPFFEIPRDALEVI